MMKKITYYVISGFGAIVALVLTILGTVIAKVIGIIGLIAISTEFFSGRYKKYLDGNIDESQKIEQEKRIKKTLLPFIILIFIAIVFVIYLIISKIN